ncbi:MAG TPA: glycosyltransferase family 2 protein [Blastocatellia bacterium]|nr:glycosyltransferase family 2 protein [Blastocatellia bacterium]
MTPLCLLLILELLPLMMALLTMIAWPKVAPATRPHPGRVSVLIPARNEEAHLRPCLESVLRQGEVIAEILVYDDHSTDGTSAVIADYEGRRCVGSVAPQPLPPGWCGKNFACAQLAAAAKGEWFLFIDADARLSDGAVAGMVEEAGRRRLTFLSCWPGFEMESFWERTLMPMLNFVVFTLFPAPFSLRFFRPSLALAHGACLMIERESYRRLGGHTAVREQIFEDVRLAQLWRQRGERGLCLDGQHLVRVRMYGSFAEIWRGFLKNFFPAFHYRFNFWVFLAFHAVFFLWPFLGLIWMGNLHLITIVGIVLSARLALGLYFRHPWWSVMLHPLSEAVLISIGLTSWWRCRSGRGVEWRGRRYEI